MGLYDQMLNITKEELEPRIEKAMEDTKNELKDLTEERTCLIYHSYLYRNLQKHHLLSHLISTKNLGLSYEHYFILIKQNDIQNSYFLSDLTYGQFLTSFPQEEYEQNLLEKGYTKIKKEQFQHYLERVAQKEQEKKIDLMEAFMMPSQNSSKKR